MKKIYIAGKVSGEPITQCTMKFDTAQKFCESLGFEAINPLLVVNDWHTDWHTAMKLCIKALMDCDAIVVLDDYVHSEGARIEVDLAKRLGIIVFYGIADLKKYEIC